MQTISTRRIILALLLSLFALPGQALAATRTVTSTADDGVSLTPGTLRWAVSIAAPGDVIDFADLSSSVPNTITVLSTIILNTPQVTIDGSAHPPVIGANPSITAIQLNGGAVGCAIKNISVINADWGIFIYSSGNIITGCRVGLDWQGNAHINSIGIYLTGNNNLVGGNRAAGSPDPNIISANYNYGIVVSSSSNTIAGNIIGLAPDGVSPMGNTNIGIGIMQGNLNMIGGVNSDASHIYGNVVSANNQGMLINGGNYNCLQGNVVGMDKDGVTAVGNVSNGIALYNNSTGNVIGGTASGTGNIISGNGSHGIQSSFSNPFTKIQGNYIGCNAAGTAAVVNSGLGISETLGMSWLIGGTEPGAGNYILGNSGGIYLDETAGNTVVGNVFGMLPNGSMASTPAVYGIGINMAHDNWIGLAGSGQGNLITSTQYGVVLHDAATVNNGLFGNTICGFALSAILSGAGCNHDKAAPVISHAYTNGIDGTCEDGNYVELFTASRGAGLQGGSLRWLGVATTAGTTWTFTPAGLQAGDVVTALATDGSNNTSVFATNILVSLPPSPTYTVTDTATDTPTFTATPTFTGTPTITETFTITDTATITQTFTYSPTSTATLTSSPTSTATPTPTASPTASGTSTITLTFTISPTSTITPTVTATRDYRFGPGGVRAYPNPGQDRVRFVFDLQRPAALKVVIYNLAGEKTAELSSSTDGVLVWNCPEAATGVYLARVFIDQRLVRTIKLAVEH